MSLLLLCPFSLVAQEIERSKVIHRNGRKITIEKLIFPDGGEEALKKAEPLKPEQQASLVPSESTQTEHSFIVHAVVYDQETSFVRWSTLSGGKKESYSCWSNINWGYLQTLHKIQSDRGNFSFMLLSHDTSLKALQERIESGEDIHVPVIPPELPPLKEVGARYLVTIGDESSDSPALEFIEAVHELYDAERQQLVEAHHDHLREERWRKHQLLINPPKLPDLVIRYGRVPSPKTPSKSPLQK
jgi:hypothetical protein